MFAGGTGAVVIVHRRVLLEAKVTYDNVVAAEFADLECEASANSC